MADPPQAHRTGPVRLRLACDACSTTKVKCDKARPACQRCVASGLYCVYSVSRRNGSKPWYKRVQQRQSQIDRQLSIYSHDAVPTDALLAAPRSLSSGPNPMGSLSICPDAAAGAWDDLDFALSSQEPFVGGGDDHDHERGHIDSPWMSPLEGDSPGAILFAGMPEQQLPEHDCENRASNLLRSLHYDPSLFAHVKQASAADVPPVDGDGPVTIPSVDKIILANRAALATLPDLFDCPCSRYPHMALLDVAILSKVLFWYRVAICALNTPSQSGGADEAAVLEQQQQPGSVTSGSSASQSGSFDGGRDVGKGGVPSMRPVSIQLGELQLDAEDQAVLQSGILLRELQKMKGLIHKFRELDVCWAAEDTESSGDASASQWCRLAMPKICQELEALCRMATGNREGIA
ncbi:hypothetical protein CORC01_09705 [Colletotrichum orchidophilum]|uniref:Zn(2)-C6 fungal-type domain-containing protein n=1 Tax=Colletotrichum orchidophilum TaxID=1209926 RepID=A0A1G4B0V6_9PEZI|nr:uncharacterized protein CORC01_09705 [Colletotrichum orchidophilum]OHE95048.1 hypothetical protein CORC01_09705 [Colletotrichum orchidophilum]